MSGEQWAGRQCRGHGVEGQAESLRLGHWVNREYLSVFTTSNGAAALGKGFAQNLMARCNICRSIKGWHDHSANARERARKWRQQHATRFAHRRGMTESQLLTEMDHGDLTVETLARLLIDAIGEPCPGLCAYESNGALHVHTLTRVQDMQLDVRDPAYPFSVENVGVLCGSCNQSKGNKAWAEYIHQRRVAYKVWESAIADPTMRATEQLTIN